MNVTTVAHAIEAAQQAVEEQDLSGARYWLDRAAEAVEAD